MDFRTLKKLSIGGVELKQLFINGIQAWKAITFKNLVPESIDTDGSIFNGTGYKDNVRLSSSGGISSSAQNGAVTTGFIPWHGDGDVLRMKGVEWLNTTANYDGHYYMVFYDGDKKKLNHMSSETQATGNMDHILTATRDADGVETFIWNKDYGTGNTMLQSVRQASFIRITARGKGADMIVTINEEIA